MIHARIIIADDHDLVRAGFRSLLSALEGIEVVAEAADGQDALEKIEKFMPDIALVDISMPKLNGLEVARRAFKTTPETRSIILSMHVDREYVSAALQAGARGYVLKGSKPEELARAIGTVMHGKIHLCSAAAETCPTRHVMHASPVHAAEPLTSRQREIVQLISEGRSTKEIASQLNLSIKTVESHRADIMKRLNIHEIAGIVRYAMRSGIIRPE